MTLLVHGLHGLGDQLHSRPLIRAAASREPVYLQTPWPSLYRDLSGVYPVHANSKLRTQAKNEKRAFRGWREVPPGPIREVRMSYGSRTMTEGSLHDALEAILPIGDHPFIYDAPDFGPSPIQAPKPIAVVRPVTVRKEWCAVARNCLPGYIAIAADALHDAGFYVVIVADVDDDAEGMPSPHPKGDISYIRGELEVERLFALVANAAVVVTPVGWCLHAAIAYKRPTICIAGGRGGHCAPWKETDPRQDLSRLRWMMPDRYCMCDLPAHECTKTITDFRPRFLRTMNSL